MIFKSSTHSLLKTLFIVVALSLTSKIGHAYEYQGSLGSGCDQISQLVDCLDMTCVNATCQICTTNDECRQGEDTTYQHCIDNVCRTKRIFDGFLWEDGVVTGLIFVSGMLAAGAGIGGGGLYVPIFLMFGWGKLAVVRSLAATTGLALALLFLVMFQRHPEADRPAVDYRAMLVLEPIVLLGTVPGKILNDLFPPVIVYVFLLVLLLVITYRSWLKYFKFKARDDARLANEALEVELSELGDVESSNVEKKLDSDDGVVVSEALRGYSPKTAKRKQIKRQLTIHKESKNPVRSILLLVLCWAVLLALALSIKLETECNSTLYWILTALYVPVLWSFSIAYGIIMGKKHRRKLSMDFEWVSGDIQWTNQRVVMYPLAFFFAGLMSSLLGIGGGMVIAPLLLEIGMHPSVANATTGVMTLFTASSAALLYLIQDIETYDYFVWYMMVAFIAGLIGRFIINDYIKKTGKQALAIFFLAFLISGACVLTVFIAVDRIVSDIQNDVPIEFAEMCSAEK